MRAPQAEPEGEDLQMVNTLLAGCRAVLKRKPQP